MKISIGPSTGDLYRVSPAIHGDGSVEVPSRGTVDDLKKVYKELIGGTLQGEHDYSLLDTSPTDDWRSIFSKAMNQLQRLKSHPNPEDAVTSWLGLLAQEFALKICTHPSSNRDQMSRLADILALLELLKERGHHVPLDENGRKGLEEKLNTQVGNSNWKRVMNFDGCSFRLIGTHEKREKGGAQIRAYVPAYKHPDGDGTSPPPSMGYFYRKPAVLYTLPQEDFDRVVAR